MAGVRPSSAHSWGRGGGRKNSEAGNKRVMMSATEAAQVFLSPNATSCACSPATRDHIELRNLGSEIHAALACDRFPRAHTPLLHGSDGPARFFYAQGTSRGTCSGSLPWKVLSARGRD